MYYWYTYYTATVEPLGPGRDSYCRLIGGWFMIEENLKKFAQALQCFVYNHLARFG